MQAGEALSLILKLLPGKALREAFLPIEDVLGMVTCRAVISPEDLPSFARSTVDGYAVRAGETFGASDTTPAYLTLSGEIFMGEKPEFSLERGTGCKIPTGGMLPPQADSVVMFEHVQTVGEKMIEVLRAAGPGENVIQAGEDVKKSATIIPEGHRMRPQDIGACAGTGITSVSVYERPRVSVISTGDEIMPAGSSLEPGQVRDINSYLLSGMITEAGCLPLKKGILRDDYDSIRTEMERSMADSDVILLTGGTSVGIKDMIARIIDDIGNPGVVFHGVSLKPGKPMIGGGGGQLQPRARPPSGSAAHLLRRARLCRGHHRRHTSLRSARTPGGRGRLFRCVCAASSQSPERTGGKIDWLRGISGKGQAFEERGFSPGAGGTCQGVPR